MADRKALKFVGVLFAIVMLAVTAIMLCMVKGHADGRYRLEGARTAIAWPAES
jgi:hypothetical protein